jgi:hypothetical protein
LKGSPSTPREISLVTSADEMALLVNRSLLLSGWMTPAYQSVGDHQPTHLKRPILANSFCPEIITAKTSPRWYKYLQ